MRSSLRLKPKTPLQKQQIHKINTILMHLINHQDSIDFREPVDWKALALYDYPQVVKRPMDLGTIQTKLKDKEKKYKTVEHALNDIQLVWDNCKLYNPRESEIYSVADKLELSFRKMVKNYLPQLKISTVTSSPHKPILEAPFTVVEMVQRSQEQASLEQKKIFAQKMSLLLSDQLQEMINKIKIWCPEVFVEKNEEQAIIEVDRMQAKIFLRCKQQKICYFKAFRVVYPFKGGKGE